MYCKNFLSLNFFTPKIFLSAFISKKIYLCILSNQNNSLTMPKLTIKSLKEYAKNEGCNSSKDALTMMKGGGFERQQGLDMWALAVKCAKANGRKTVLDKDVEGLIALHKSLTCPAEE